MDAWLQTYSGLALDYLNPQPEQIALGDIAHALSNLCRFAGHTRSFYAVSQHSVLVSRIVSPELAPLALMHDAAEAYVCDLPAPLKRNLTGSYGSVEDRVHLAVLRRFGLSYWIWDQQTGTLILPDEIKHADLTLLATEKRDLLSPEPRPWGVLPRPLPERIEPLPSAEAKALFLERAAELGLDEVADVAAAS